MEERFDKLFIYRKNGQWLRNIDGYEDEDGNFIYQPNKAYAVPDFFKQFITQEISLARSQWVTKLRGEISQLQGTKDELKSKYYLSVLDHVLFLLTELEKEEK